MTRQEIEAKLAQIRSEKEAIRNQREALMSSSGHNSEPKRGAQEPKTREEIEAKLAEIRAQKQAIAQERDALMGGASTQPPEKEHSWRESLGELMESPGSAVASGMDTLTAPLRWAGVPIPSAREIRESVYTPKTKLGKFGETAGDYMGTSAALLPYGSALGAGAKAISGVAPRLSKVGSVISDYGLGTMPATGAAASSLAKHTLAGSSVASGLEHGSGWDPMAAGLAYPAALVTKVAGHAGLNAVKNIPTPSRSAAKSLKDAIGEDEVAQILKELEAGPTSEFPKGYKPTTAELSENPSLLAFERAHMGHTPETATHHAQNMEALHRGLQGTAPAEGMFSNTLKHVEGVKAKQEKSFLDQLNAASQKREKNVADFGAPSHVSHKAQAEDLRSATHSELTKREKLRSKESAPLYKAFHNDPNKVDVEGTTALLDELSKEGLQGLAQSDVTKLKKLLKPVKNSMQSQDLTDLVEAAYHPEKLSQEALKETLGGWGEAKAQKTGKELHNILKDVIDPAIKTALQTKNMGRYHVLASVKNAIHDDLQVLPAFAKAQAKYRMLSEPINEILRDPSLGPLLKQDVYKSGYTSRAAAHLPQFLKGISSEENASALVKVIGKDPKAMNNLRSYVRHQFLHDVMDESGKININTIDKWRNANQGAFKIDPELNKLAHKIGSSELAIKKIEAGQQLTEKTMKPLWDTLLGPDAEMVVGRVLSSPKSRSMLKEIAALTKQDKSGKSFNGLQKGIADYLERTLSLASQTTKGEHNLSFDKIRRLMATKSGALSEVFDPSQMKELTKVFNALKSRNRVLTAGAATGSPTESYKQLHEMLAHDAYGQVEKFIPKGWMEFAYKGAKKAGSLYTKRKKDQVVKMLMSPEAFKESMKAQPKTARKLDREPLKNATRSAFLTFLQGNK